MMKRRVIQITLLEILIIATVSCVGMKKEAKNSAPGAPGNKSTWTYAGKTGIGTSYEAYTNGTYATNDQTGNVSKVWFSLAKGILTETMYGLIHEAQINEMQFIIVGDGFVDQEKKDTESEISYLYTDEKGVPASLAYKVVNRDKEGKYEIEKHFFTNPEEDALFVRTIFRSKEANIVPYLYLNPHVNNTGGGDYARVDPKVMHAWEGDKHLVLLSSKKFKKASAGFVGVSDGISELEEQAKLKSLYDNTGETSGNVATIAQLAPMSESGVQYDFVIGFGATSKEARNAASQTLNRGYDEVLKNYNGEGDYHGWEDYLNGLHNLEDVKSMATDGGKLAQVSAMVLKAQEDKTHAGALIASLSNPWGETASAENSGTGYKAVWPRDFYQCAMAFLALGDVETPLTAFQYLPKVQVNDATPGNKGVKGWFLQKTVVDGTIEWTSVQLDQTAMPIMLGWQLWKKGILSSDEAKEWYHKMLQPAAEFLVTGGDVDMAGNTTTVNPPWTQQERWEEQSGYSPSTTAAVVSGLVAAADFAILVDDEVAAERFLKKADEIENSIEKYMFTTNGRVGDGHYFVRVTQNKNPNDRAEIGKNNGKPAMGEDLILDAGFLELVRYGVRKANDPSILESIEELDRPREENLQVKYLFQFEGDEKEYPGWRRYGNDGYGESVSDGANYGVQEPSHRGRVWPFFTGERAHYELSKAKENGSLNRIDLRNTYVKAMEYFANEGFMLPEQVYDGVGVPSPGYKVGEGTNAATPLAWTHAEYIKMLRSLHDEQVWDRYPNVESRYAGK